MSTKTVLVFIFAVLVSSGIAQATCEFGQLSLQVDETVCNETTGSQQACTSDGTLLSLELPCSFAPRHCLQGASGSNSGINIVRLGATACLNELVYQCTVQYRRTTVRVRVQVKPRRRRWWGVRQSNGQVRYRWVNRIVYVRVNVLRTRQQPCQGEGCVLPPRLTKESNSAVLETNETQCIHGVRWYCDEQFVLVSRGVCSCLFKHHVVLEGETVCDSRLGVESLCVEESGTFTLQPNGTCEVQCRHHDTLYAVNHTLCLRGRKRVCLDTGSFQRQGYCNCEFDGVIYRPFQRWCSDGRRYRCDGYGETVSIGSCSCAHNGRSYATGSTWCHGPDKLQCQVNGSYQKIGACPRTCRSSGVTYNAGAIICVGNRRRYCFTNGRWYTIGWCRRRQY